VTTVARVCGVFVIWRQLAWEERFVGRHGDLFALSWGSVW
jgi:hypothetical protein